VTKVVTFGAFVEILPGVEGLVHISELASHHVENPREVVSQGETVRAKIIEMDAERRRLSLSLKRVGDDEERMPGAELGLSEEVFSDEAALAESAEAEPSGEAEAAPRDGTEDTPVAEVESGRPEDVEVSTEAPVGLAENGEPEPEPASVVEASGPATPDDDDA
jgi:small subunit ribosomal protein S1